MQMISNEHLTFYDVLDLKPDASTQEIREAYLRAKSAYNKDSVALYSLISSDEREEMLRRIEEAYHVLSNPQKRKEYDISHGLINPEEEPLDFVRLPTHRKIISIDRVPPMTQAQSDEDLLVPPTTDFTTGARPTATATPASPFEPDPFSTGPQQSSAFPPPMTAQPSHEHAASVQHLQPQAQPIPAPAMPATPEQMLLQEIMMEVEWRGAFLKKIREARRLSIEEISGVTKITKTYVQAVEEENFAKLPAAVYVRGFVTQIAKVLRLPAEKPVAAYMARYLAARPEQRK